MFSILKDGCEDFVDQMHTQQSQGRLLYGFAPTETIASLVFDIARRTVKLKSFHPEIPTPYRIYPPFTVKYVTIALTFNINSSSKLDEQIQSMVNSM